MYSVTAKVAVNFVDIKISVTFLRWKEKVKLIDTYGGRWVHNESWHTSASQCEAQLQEGGRMSMPER